jgi:hypothetical protein
MKIPVFLHTANPFTDAPLCHKSHGWVIRKIAAGVLVAVIATIGGVQRDAAQYITSRGVQVEAPRCTKDRATEIGYDRSVIAGRDLVWVPSGETWQMKTTYGSMSRHFGATKNGMNFAPNKTTSPSDHQVGV